MAKLRDIDFDSINSAALANPSYIESRLPEARKVGDELVAGNIHGDPGKSFKINRETGKWADFAGNERGGDPVSFVAAQEGVGQAEAAMLIARDLRLSSSAPLRRKSKELPECPVDWSNPTFCYSYFTVDGEHAFDVLRWEKTGHRKTIRQSRGVDEQGKRITNNQGAVLVPYNLVGPSGKPTVVESGFVVIVEGENKADVLIERGICATCNPGGAGRWKTEYTPYFQGKTVVILPDNDTAGNNHASDVATALAPVAASVKVVALPGLPAKGDILDWFKSSGNDLERLQALMNDAPYWENSPDATSDPASEAEPRPLAVDWTSFGGVSYLNAFPAPYEYLLQNAFLKRELGVIAGPPGCGKGTFSLQMAAFIAAGLPVFGWWGVPEPTRVLYISAEDSQAVIHHRLYDALQNLPSDKQYDAATRIVAIPVRGRVNLCQGDSRTGFSLTETLADLKKIISEFKPGLVILDTLSRFLNIGENDNAGMTAGCGIVEEIIEKYGCNVIMLHHVGKGVGDCVESETELIAALSQNAIRGASSIAGAVRFAIVLAPLGKKLAGSFFGDEAKNKPAGSYVCARAAKKNNGAPEPFLHLARGKGGMLERIERIDAEKAIGEAAGKLADEVKRREDAGEPPLSFSKGASEFLNCGIPKGKAVTEWAMMLGLIEAVDKAKGHGKVLKFCEFQEGQNFGNDNEI